MSDAALPFPELVADYVPDIADCALACAMVSDPAARVHGWQKQVNDLIRELQKQRNEARQVCTSLTIQLGKENAARRKAEAALLAGNGGEPTAAPPVEAARAEVTDAPRLNELSKVCHQANMKWWRNPETGEPLDRNKGELLCLIHSEISEAMEGERKDLMDDKLPHRRMAEVELVDALIRIFDYAGAFGYDLDGAFVEKMKFNVTREDHANEARLLAGGKKW